MLTEITFGIEKHFLAVSFSFDQNLVQRVKQTDGRIWDIRKKRWLMPFANPATQQFFTEVSQRQNSIIHYHDTSWDKVQETFARYATMRENLERLTDKENTDGHEALFPFQRVGAAFMVEACRLYGGVLQACEVGLGKTVQAIMAWQELERPPMLLLAPKSVLHQWRDELQKWADVEALLYSGTPKERLGLRSLFKNAPVVIMSYETFRQDVEEIPQQFSMILADEAHRLGNRQSKLYKAVSRFQTDYHVALTATPIMNRLPELFGIISWIAPGLLGTWEQFLSRYCVQNYWGAVTGAQNVEELKTRISGIVFRRTVEQVELDLPPVRYEHLPVALSASEQSLYTRIQQELLFELQEAEVSKLESPMMLQSTLVKMGKLIELCDSMELLGDSTASSKLDALRDHLLDVIGAGHKVIIFTRFSRMADILLRELVMYNPVCIQGSMTESERAESIQRFNNYENVRVLVATEAGSVGLNLQVASVCYHYDLPFSVGKFIQRTGRLVRIGQQKPVLVILLVAQKTIEEYVKKLLLKKIKLSKDLLEDETVFSSLSQVRDILSE